MRLLEFLKLIPQPELNIVVYTVDHVLITHDTLFNTIIRLEKNRNEDKYELSRLDYIFTYEDIKYLSFYDDTICISLELEDDLRIKI